MLAVSTYAGIEFRPDHFVVSILQRGWWRSSFSHQFCIPFDTSFFDGFFPLDARYCSHLFQEFFDEKLGLKSSKIKIVFGLPNCFVRDFFWTTEKLKEYQAEQEACLHFAEQSDAPLQEHELYIRAFLQPEGWQVYLAAVKRHLPALFETFFVGLGKRCSVICTPIPIAWLNYFKYLEQGNGFGGVQDACQKAQNQFLLSRALAISGLTEGFK